MRQTEGRWQEHLRRFEIIEQRSKIYSDIGKLINTNQLSKSKLQDNTDTATTQLLNVSRKQSSILQPNGGRLRLKRSISIETIPDESYHYADSSDDDFSFKNKKFKQNINV